MKKRVKKLVLAKETLQRLGDLTEVWGAASAISGCKTCYPDDCPREYSGSDCTNC